MHTLLTVGHCGRKSLAYQWLSDWLRGFLFVLVETWRTSEEFREPSMTCKWDSPLWLASSFILMIFSLTAKAPAVSYSHRVSRVPEKYFPPLTHSVILGISRDRLLFLADYRMLFNAIRKYTYFRKYTLNPAVVHSRFVQKDLYTRNHWHVKYELMHDVIQWVEHKYTPLA